MDGITLHGPRGSLYWGTRKALDVTDWTVTEGRLEALIDPAGAINPFNLRQRPLRADLYLGRAVCRYTLGSLLIHGSTVIADAAPVALEVSA